MSLDLKFDNGFKITLGEYPGIAEGQEILCVVKERLPGMDNWGVLESITMRQNTFFVSYRSFLGDIKVEAYCFDLISGLYKIDDKHIEIESKTVRIDMFPENLNDLKAWIEQSLIFSSIHNSNLFISVRDDMFLERVSDIFKDSGIKFLRYDDFVGYDSRFEIGRFDLELLGIQMTGCQEIYQRLSCGWILQSGWRYFRSFKNPRDWNFLQSFQIARDILNLPDVTDPRKGYVKYEYWKNRINSSEQNLVNQ
jgi:hypothetical protein